MDDFIKRTWAQIDIEAVRYNFKNIKEKLGKGVKMLCVLKADAYGHGASFLVREYEKMGADWYGVSNIDEALQLRKAGAIKPILIFGYTPEECAEILHKNNISQAVFSLEYAKKLHEVCKAKGIKVKAHIKIDTGMSRIGFFSQTKESQEKSVNEIIEISKMSGIEIEGIFTHFSVADDVTNNKEYTLMQFSNFKAVINALEENGVKISLKHCCNSGGILNFPDMQMNMVRAGVILYGLYPSDEVRNKIDLKPVMQLKTVVSQVKEVPSNIGVSYGRTFVTSKKIKIASVPIGYADGYSLKFSNNSFMLIHGKKAKLIGRVCMDQAMLDVTDLENVKEGDEVTVFGKDGDNFLTVDELAKKTDTINYEIVCLIGKRVPRVYFEGSKIIKKVSYI